MENVGKTSPSTAEVPPIFDLGGAEPEIAVFLGKSGWFFALTSKKRAGIGSRLVSIPPRRMGNQWQIPSPLPSPGGETGCMLC
jgi:hypothetical protein